MARDINLHSFTGPEYNGKAIDWSSVDIIPEGEISDSVKLTSRLTEFTASFGQVVGGKEDCLDVNNQSENIDVRASLWVPKGKYLATIKGGSRNIKISGNVIGHGSEVDIDIGNISDQCIEPTGPVFLSLNHITGDVITVRVINGTKPIILNPGEQRYRIVFSLPAFFGRLFAKCVRLLRKFRLV